MIAHRHKELPEAAPDRALFDDELAWLDGVDDTAVATPFQTRAWYRAWAATVAPVEGKRPLIYRAPKTGPARLVAAMQIGAGADGRAEISPLGSPWADYDDAIDAGATEADLDSAAEWLVNQAMEQDLRISCRDVLPNGVLHRLLQRLSGTFMPSTETVAIDLTDDGYVQGLIERGEYQRKRRRLTRLATLKTRHLIEAAEIEEAFPGFVALHRAQWDHRADAVAPFRESGVLAGFSAIARACARAGSFVLSEMRLGGDLIAGYLGFRVGPVYFGYRTAFRADLFRYSPGHILLQDMMSDFRRQGVHTLDLMRGAYTYKAQYGTGFARNLAWSDCAVGAG